MPEKIVIAYLLLLVGLSAAFAHIDNQHRIEEERQEEARLDMNGVIGWIQYDPKTMQFVFSRR